MAIDLDALKRKLASFERPKSNIKYWKPVQGEHKVRVLPWADQPADSPIKEFYYYYLGQQQRILAPFQFGMEDPVRDLYNQLSRSREKGDWEKKKLLEPKMTACYLLIDRAQEDAGPLLWTFNVFTYKRLIGLLCKYVEEEGADFSDPEKGCDFDVKITPSGKMFNNKPVLDTVIDLARKSSPLSKDKKKVDEWLKAAAAMDMKDHYKPPTKQEVENTFNAWLREGESSEPVLTSASRGLGAAAAVPQSGKPSATASATSALDEMFADLTDKLDYLNTFQPRSNMNPWLQKQKRETKKSLLTFRRRCLKRTKSTISRQTLSRLLTERWANSSLST